MAIFILCSCATGSNREEEEISADLKSPQIELGEVEAQFETMLGMGKLVKQKVKMIYFPLEDAVALYYRHEFVNYHQFWSESGRELFIGSLARYNNDYDSRDLDSKSRLKNLNKYGTTRGYLIWQMLSITVQAKGNMDMELGYVFKDRAPYFTVNQKVAEYTDPDATSDHRQSMVITLYFTRAQAAEVAALFDSQLLKDTRMPKPARVETETPDTTVEWDEY